MDVRAKPGSRVEGLDWDGDVLTARVRARAVEGQANNALVGLLSKVLKVPKSAVQIEKGASGRNKRVSILGLDRASFIDRIGPGLK